MSDPASNGEIQQQADHAQDVTQIGHAENVTINRYGASSPSPEPPPKTSKGLSANQVAILVAVIGLIGTVVAAVIGILPDLLPAPQTATPTASPSPTVTLPTTAAPVALASESPLPATTPPPSPPQATAAPTDAVLPATQPGEQGVAITLYRDADSLTLYVPDQGTISLAGLSLAVERPGGPVAHPLSDFNFGLPLAALPTPLCLRLERNSTTRPLPIACDVGVVINRPLTDADVFWHDGRQARPILIRAGETQIGVFGTDSAELSLNYPEAPPVPPSTLPPSPTAGIFISAIDIGTWDSTMQSCSALVHVTVSGANPIAGNLHVWNAAYDSAGDVFSAQVFPVGQSVHVVTLGGREEEYKVHEIWITSDTGVSNHIGGLVCENWGQ